MVRIRSDRWYSGENQKKIRRGAPANSSGTRRVMSLIFLLVLVMLLMRNVSNPQTVSRAFHALGMPLEQEVIDASHPELKLSSLVSPESGQNSKKSEKPSSSSDHLGSEGDSAWVKSCRDLIPRVLEVATAEQVNQLALYLFSTPNTSSRISSSGFQGPDVAPIIKSLRDRLDLTQNKDQLWNEKLLRFEKQWDLLVDLVNSNVDQVSQSSELDSVFRTQLIDWVDKRLLSNFRDASPWIGVETVGFGRLLQRSQSFSSAGSNVPHASTRQLDTELTKLRGTWVKFRGTVRLVETVKRPQPLLNQSVYYVLWLRGQDQSVQPVAVYTAQPIAEKFAREVEAERFPDVEVSAIVGKKLAYASASGVQVTPALFADAIVQYQASQATVQPESTKLTIWHWALGAVVVIAGCLFFITSVSKQLRRKKRSASSIVLLIAFCICHFGGSTLAYSAQSQAAESQDPPWLNQGDVSRQLLQFAEQRLQPVFTPELQSQLAETLDGRSVAAPDFVLRSIFAIKQAGWKQLWHSKSDIRLNAQYSLIPIELEGTVRVVQPLNLSDYQQEWFSVQPTRSIYRLQVDLSKAATPESSSASTPQLVTVFCVHVPSIWKNSAQLKQPVRIRCFGLSRGPIVDGNNALVRDAVQSPAANASSQEIVCHIADHLAWRVDAVDENSMQHLLPKLPTVWAELGRQGWDLSWFDLLADNNKRPISGDETGAFHSMLAITASEASARSVTSEPTPKLQLIQALQETASHLGEKIDWTVRLVSASKVKFGETSEYYQLDGFVRMPPGQIINFDSGRGDGRLVEFKGEFPVTILTLAQPNLLNSGQAKMVGEGAWKVGLQTQVQGRFFRVWSYESERVKTSAGNGRLIAPLVMASTITEIHNPLVMNRSGGWWIYLVAMFFIVAVSCFIQIRLRTRRSKPR